MARRKITWAQAQVAYDILVAHAGAHPDERERWSFAHYVSNDDDFSHEYRFQGKLGFGGKFRNNWNNDGVPYVDCYPEHETPERAKIIAKVNAQLAELFATPEPSPCAS